MHVVEFAAKDVPAPEAGAEAFFGLSMYSETMTAPFKAQVKLAVGTWASIEDPEYGSAKCLGQTWDALDLDLPANADFDDFRLRITFVAPLDTHVWFDSAGVGPRGSRLLPKRHVHGHARGGGRLRRPGRAAHPDDTAAQLAARLMGLRVRLTTLGRPHRHGRRARPERRRRAVLARPCLQPGRRLDNARRRLAHDLRILVRRDRGHGGTRGSRPRRCRRDAARAGCRLGRLVHRARVHGAADGHRRRAGDRRDGKDLASVVLRERGAHGVRARASASRLHRGSLRRRRLRRLRDCGHPAAAAGQPTACPTRRLSKDPPSCNA